MPNAPRRPRASARDETADTAVTAPEAPAPPPPPPPPAAPTAERSAPDPVVTRAWLLALLMAAIGAVVGMLFLHYRKPPGIGSAAGFRISSLFLLVIAIERVIEVVNHFRPLGGTGPAPARYPARVALCLGLASALAMIACGYFGIGVFHAFGDNGSPRYIDVIVTGLGIGAATKPLHDLIRIIERRAHPQTGERR
jgi:hypothetical protein